MVQTYRMEVQERVVLPWMDAALTTVCSRRGAERRHYDQRHVVNLILSPWTALLAPEGRTLSPAGNFRTVGRSFMTPADLPLQFQMPHAVQARSLRCSFEQNRFEEISEMPSSLFHERFRDCVSITHPGVVECLARISREVRSPGFASPTLVESMGIQTIIELTRYFRMCPGGQAVAALSNRHVRLIEDRCRSDEPLPTVEELALLCGLSARQLLRVFKAVRGITLSDYIAELRVERARSLLAGTSLPIKEIAYRLGFSSPGSFSVAFSREVCISPLAFRNLHS